MKRTPALRTLVAAAAGLVAVGCRSFGPPRDATLLRIAPMPLARGLEPGQFVLELLSPGLAGTFDAVWGIDADGLRLQLFPDVGGKVLDLRIGADTVTAELPGSSYRATAPLDRAPPHLALVLAAVMAELAAPIDRARVLGERIGADGRTEVRLLPALGSGAVTATLAADGAIAAYAIELGAIRLLLTADGIFVAPGLSGHVCP